MAAVGRRSLDEFGNEPLGLPVRQGFREHNRVNASAPGVRQKLQKIADALAQFRDFDAGIARQSECTVVGETFQ